MVNDIVDGTTTAYDVHPVTKKLKHRQTIVSRLCIPVKNTTESAQRSSVVRLTTCPKTPVAVTLLSQVRPNCPPLVAESNGGDFRLM